MPKLATDADAERAAASIVGCGRSGVSGRGRYVTAAIPSVRRSKRFTALFRSNAAHFARSGNGNIVAQWRVLADLGISGESVVFGEPGRTPPFGTISTLLPIKGGIFPWLEYDFTTTTAGPATLALHLLPTFPH